MNLWRITVFIAAAVLSGANYRANARQSTEVKITPREFIELVRAGESYEKIPDAKLSQLKKGDRFFGQLKWLKPGQARYSFELSVEKALEYTDGDGTFENPELKYDDGRSLLPEDDPVHVVLTDYGLIAVDGHHHVMASLATGAKTAPFLVVGDLRGRNSGKLKAALVRRGYSYPYDLDGSVRYPQHFYTLENDTNRYLVSLLTTRVDVDPKSGKITRIGSKGGNYPVLIKIRPGISKAFQELRAADVLRRAGIVYDPTADGGHPSRELREKARRALAEAQRRGDPDMANILSVKNRTFVDDIPMQTLVTRWIKSRCEIKLQRR